MKKIVLITTAVSLLLLSACGKTTTVKEETKTLEFWQTYTGERQKIFQEAIDRFKAKHPDVEVKMVQEANEPYKQKISVASAGGKLPDVFQSWGGGWLKEFVDQGKILDLTDKVNKDTYIPNVLANGIIKDKIYGVPLGLTLTLFFYNTEIFQKYNLKPPATWDELLHVVDTLKSNGITPIALENQAKWPGSYYSMYLADRIAGPKLFDSAFHRNGKGFDDAAYVESNKYIQALVKRGAFNEGFNGVQNGQGLQLFYNEKAAMVLYNTNFIPLAASAAPEIAKKTDFFPFPTLPGGQGDASNLNAAASPVWSVSKDSRYPELAAELLKELSSQETAQAYIDRQVALVAVKGVNYTNPTTKRLAKFVDDAKSISWPYDQVLPPELAQLYLSTNQEVFGGTLTAEDAAAKVEQKAKDALK